MMKLLLMNQADEKAKKKRRRSSCGANQRVIVETSRLLLRKRVNSRNLQEMPRAPPICIGYSDFDVLPIDVVRRFNVFASGDDRAVEKNEEHAKGMWEGSPAKDDNRRECCA